MESRSILPRSYGPGREKRSNEILAPEVAGPSYGAPKISPLAERGRDAGRRQNIDYGELAPVKTQVPLLPLSEISPLVTKRDGRQLPAHRSLPRSPIEPRSSVWAIGRQGLASHAGPAPIDALPAELPGRRPFRGSKSGNKVSVSAALSAALARASGVGSSRGQFCRRATDRGEKKGRMKFCRPRSPGRAMARPRFPRVDPGARR
jgi:hypothetical protein